MTSSSLLEIEGLEVEYRGRGLRRKSFKALHGVSLDVRPGETVGVVGESGSGKSTMGRAVLGLAPVTGGAVRFGGRDISHISRRERRSIAGELQVVFQDPYSSLNPTLTVGDSLAEPLRARGVKPAAASARITELLDLVGLPSGATSRLPREFSGGQRQRVAIARALAFNPRLIVCDEPVSALDLTTQARVLELFRELQERTGVAYLFISHDLSVVRVMSHRVAVMREGRIVEWGQGSEVTVAPSHPYTQRLLLAAPVADPHTQAERRTALAALKAAS
jgi:ABC-type glutathione transport system ATPase component